MSLRNAFMCASVGGWWFLVHAQLVIDKSKLMASVFPRAQGPTRLSDKCGTG